jgi:predicted cupin superfamily sugar epimerase
MMMTAEEVIKALSLEKHPKEGGYFVETYRSAETVFDEKRGKRSYSTAIYYMLTPDTFSEMHCLPIDEVYHFYLGDAVEMLHLYPDNTGKQVILGSNPEAGMRPQVLVPAGVWQGSRIAPGGKYGFALIGTTMAPGFEYADYQSGSRGELSRNWPKFKELIALLTRR